jgi:HSP20 family molecular chaperone IbpA
MAKKPPHNKRKIIKHVRAKHKKVVRKHKAVVHKKKRLPVAAPSFSQFEKKFALVEKAMDARFAALEKRVSHISGGVKMHDTPHATKIIFELPGFSKKDISAQVTDHSVTVSAETKNSAYYKAVSLPFVVIPEKSKAKFKGGELTIVLPKFKAKMPKGKKLKV